MKAGAVFTLLAISLLTGFGRPVTLPHMEISHAARMTTKEYSSIRRILGLTRKQLAAELGVALSTITKRETSRGLVKREADLAMRWLLENPPPDDTSPCPTKKRVFKQGDIFGLFTVLDSVRRRGASKRWRPRVLRVRCRCGTERTLLESNFSKHYFCSSSCPDHTAMVARGSQVDNYGDIIDRDGFPES